MVIRVLHRITSFALIAMLLISVNGCTKDKPQLVVPTGAQVVKVPVPVCGPQLEQAIGRSSTNARPLVLPVQQLTEEDAENYDKIQRAYTNTIAELLEYIGKLESDQQEVRMQCEAANEQVKTLNTVQPILPSPIK